MFVDGRTKAPIDITTYPNQPDCAVLAPQLSSNAEWARRTLRVPYCSESGNPPGRSPPNSIGELVVAADFFSASQGRTSPVGDGILLIYASFNAAVDATRRRRWGWAHRRSAAAQRSSSPPFEVSKRVNFRQISAHRNGDQKCVECPSVTGFSPRSKACGSATTRILKLIRTFVRFLSTGAPCITWI